MSRFRAIFVSLRSLIFTVVQRKIIFVCQCNTRKVTVFFNISSLIEKVNYCNPPVYIVYIKQHRSTARNMVRRIVYLSSGPFVLLSWGKLLCLIMTKLWIGKLRHEMSNQSSGELVYWPLRLKLLIPLSDFLSYLRVMLCSILVTSLKKSRNTILHST